MLTLLACLPMLWPASFCTCQLLSICGLKIEHSSKVPSDDTTLSQTDSECHCAARMPTTIPQNDSLVNVVLFDAYLPERPRILISQNFGTHTARITPPITTNSLLLQHCALIL